MMHYAKLVITFPILTIQGVSSFIIHM